MAETPSYPSSPTAAAEPAALDAPKAEPQRKLSKRKSSLKKDAAAEGGATGEDTAAPAAAADGEATAQTTTAQGDAATAVKGEAGASSTKALERRASRRKSSLKKPPSRQSSLSKKGGEQLDEDSEEEVEVPKIIYPIDPKIQDMLRKAWALFIKKGQKKKTEIAESDIPTVMRSIAINPTETQIKDVIAYVGLLMCVCISVQTKSKDVSTTSKGFLTYECFEQRMAESFQLEPEKYIRNSKERILAALYTISGGTNEVNAAELKKIMMTKGDIMTEQEAALMIRNVGDRDTGKVYVEEYADMLSKDGIPQPPPDPAVW